MCVIVLELFFHDTLCTWGGLCCRLYFVSQAFGWINAVCFVLVWNLPETRLLQSWRWVLQKRSFSCLELWLNLYIELVYLCDSSHYQTNCSLQQLKFNWSLRFLKFQSGFLLKSCGDSTSTLIPFFYERLLAWSWPIQIREDICHFKINRISLKNIILCTRLQIVFFS